MTHSQTRRGFFLFRLISRLIFILLIAGGCALLFAYFGKPADPATRAQLENFRDSMRSHTEDMGAKLNDLNERLGSLYNELKNEDGASSSALALRVGEMRERLGQLKEQFGDFASQEKWNEYRRSLEDLYENTSSAIARTGETNAKAQALLDDLRGLINRTPEQAMATPEGDGDEGR